MRRTAFHFLAHPTQVLLDILHKETSVQLKRSAAASLSRSQRTGGSSSSTQALQRLISNVTFDNGLRTLTIQGDQHSSSCTVPFEWILDHDASNLDAHGQRKCMIYPEIVNAFDISELLAEEQSNGELLLHVTWASNKKPLPPVARSDICYPPLVPSRSTVRVSPSVLSSGQCNVGSAALLPSFQSSSLHFYSRITTPHEAWTVQTINEGHPRGSLDPPMSVVVPHVNSLDLSHKVDLLQTIERNGFAVVVDPSLSQKNGGGGGGKRSTTTEEVVRRRKEAAEAIILNTFKVLRNSHYGLMSTWSADESWKNLKIARGGTASFSNSISACKTAAASTKKSTAKQQPDDVATQKNEKKKSAKGVSAPAAKKKSVDEFPDGDVPHQDGAYAASLLDLHTDGTYFVECPKLQAFGCIFHDSQLTQGGETTLADGFSVAGELAEKYPNFFRLLTSVPVGGRYEKEGKMYEAFRPVITLRPTTSCVTRLNVAQHVERISFNNSDRCPMLLGTQSSIWSAAELRTFYQAYWKFHELLHSPEFALKLLLRPGQLLFFDNHRVLHGRLKFSGPRVMCGAYVGSDEYYSSLKADGAGSLR